jgi:hypothetical protein
MNEAAAKTEATERTHHHVDVVMAASICALVPPPVGWSVMAKTIIHEHRMSGNSHPKVVQHVESVAKHH